MKGLRFFRRDRIELALPEFERVIGREDLSEMSQIDPLYLSFYGASLSIINKNHGLGENLCRCALQSGKEYPEIFLNLGRVLELAGKKQNAVRVLRNGYRLHSNNLNLLEALQQLSPRGRVPLPFLDRDNILNKYSGIIIRRSFRFNRLPN